MAKGKDKQRPAIDDVIIGQSDAEILKLVREAGNAENAEEVMGSGVFMIVLRIAEALERLVELKEVEVGVRMRAELSTR